MVNELGSEFIIIMNKYLLKTYLFTIFVVNLCCSISLQDEYEDCTNLLIMCHN